MTTRAHTDVKGRHVTVVGGARSGVAVARLLARRGAGVFLTEMKTLPEDAGAALRDAGVAFEEGGHTVRALDADLMVLSPGVSSSAQIVTDALECDIPVVSEIEVASWFCRGPIVAVTGSNGKTTTTSLIGHLFKTAERPHVVAGNIGSAFSDAVDDVTEQTVVVLEVSSFQLDHIDTFRPHVAVLLNITPDHLDRYGGSFERYAAAKFRVFENQSASDWQVVNRDDPVVWEYATTLRADRGLTPTPFSIETDLERGAFVRVDSTGIEHLTLSLPPVTSNGIISPQNPPVQEDLMQGSTLALRGRHNLYNSLAAAVVARAMEIQDDAIRESLTSFEGVPHRLEKVRTLRDVAWINDSKATNVNAVWYALESFSGNVILIAGGKDKGNDYDPLKPLVRERVKGLIAIGESAQTVMDELGPHVGHFAQADSMQQAVEYAQGMAEKGDVVLLSPACASFDMFENYEDRGNTFKRIVMDL